MLFQRDRPPRLTAFEMRALEAIAGALVPRGGAVELGADDLRVADQVARWVEGFNPAMRGLVRAMIAGFDLTPLLSRHSRLFHRLDATEQDRWVTGSPRSRIRARREALVGLRTLVGIAFASDPRAAAAIGYDGSPATPVDWDRVPPATRLPVLHFPEVAPGTDLDVDVVVVGSGAGGAVAADVLARAGLSVIVLEEGGFHDATEFRESTPLDRLSRLYRDHGMTTTFGNPVISLPMGRAVGGTTVINSGTCFRTPESVLSDWSAGGLPGVSPDDMAPHFDRVEEVLGVNPVGDDILGPNGDVFRCGAAALGYSGGPIRRNARLCHGHGACALGCPVDAKQGMHVTYLPRAVEAGATIISHVRARRILIDGVRATGVLADLLDPSTDRRRGVLRVRARATVVAAGAIFTPTILASQRIASSSGQLGRNLVIHPGVGTTARFEEELFAWKGVMQSYYVDERIDEGVLLEATFPPPGIGYSAGALPGSGREFKDLFGAYPHMAACGSIVSDGGNGSVRPMPTGSLGRSGRAIIRYDLSFNDAATLVEGIALAAEIYFAAGAREVYPMLPGLASITTPADVAHIREGRWRRSDLKVSAYHPMGTARMGADPRMSVVDPWGAVWEVPGLWVMDASILPSSTRVNPQITIMAMVSRCAAHLADVLNR